MNRLKIILWLIIAYIGNTCNLYGAGSVSAKKFINHNDWNFIENKGQLLSPDIKYYARPNGASGRGHQGGVNLYCKPGMISFVFTKVSKEPDQISEATGKGQSIALPHMRQQRSPLSALRSSISSSRADLTLLNSNPFAQIIASNQQEYYENFYLAHTPEEGITHVHTYKTITYKSIYPDIDFVLQSRDGGLEYEFVVYPGGKVSDIQIQWNGLDGIKKLKDSGIEYSFALGMISESAPYTYQGIAIPVRADPCVRPGSSIRPGAQYSDEGWTHGSAPTEKIESHFILKNNIIGFDVSPYDKSKPLIIDPFLSWGTYFGGDDFDEGYSVNTDKSGDVYIAGAAESQSGIATSGAFQTSFGGDNDDAFLAKFTSSGNLLWATYYGGSEEDYAQGVATDGLGYVYIGGFTGSSSGIATSGAYQTNNIGNSGFLAKFDTNGTRIWGTYYPTWPFRNSLTTDVYGSVYLLGTGTSGDTSLATSGAYQTTNLGTANAFLTKFSSNGFIQWATYYGGNEGTSGIGVTSDATGNVYISGSTNSTSEIATSGSYQTSYAGDGDAFLAKFNINGKIQWATYFGGSGNDIGYGCIVDKSGNIFLEGNTSSDNSIATNGAYQTFNAGDEDAFLAKFNSSGKIQWATYYGGSGEEINGGISSDDNGNIYLMGTTESTSGVASSGSYQTSFGGGNEDAFLAQFSNSGSLLWASYYGGPDEDAGFDVATDGSGNVYITGYTESAAGIATSGSYQSSIAGPENAFLAQFNFKANYDAGLSSIFSDSCAGKWPVYVNLINQGNDPFDSVNISWSLNGKLQPDNHWTAPMKPGLPPGDQTSVYLGTVLFSAGKKDTIIAWSSKPNGQVDSIPGNDTASIIINVLSLPAVPKLFPQTICQFDTAYLGVSSPVGSFDYSWTSNPALTDTTNSHHSLYYAAPNSTTTYYLTETNSKTGCSNSDTVKVSVNPAPPAKTVLPQTICFGDTINIGDTPSNGFAYNWTSSPSGFTSTLSNPKISPASTTTYTLTETNTTTGCKNSNSVQISVNQLPVADVGQPSYSICNGTHVKIGANAQPGITYLWSSSPPGYSSTISNPVVDPLAYTNYYLTVTDTATGCVNKNFAKVAVSILKAPLIDVGKNQAVCVGVSAQIGSIPAAGYSYSWTSNPVGFTSTVANPIVKPLVTSSYSLVVTDTHGCTNFDSVTITVNQRPQPKTGAPQNSCSGTVIKLGTPPDSGNVYVWTSKPKGFNSKISDPVDSPQVSTEYYLKEIISATGCADSDSVRVTVMPRPDAQFDVKNINGFGWEFIVQKPNYPGSQYHWTFGDTSGSVTDTTSGYNVTHTYPQNGAYMVYLTISLLDFCTVIDSYRVIVNVQPTFDIYPNPFDLQTEIKYVLENPGHVKITMTDDIGRFIGTLVDEQLSRGEYITIFDAAAWKTRPAVYFIIYQLDNKITIRKIVQIDSIYH